jgi:hypothetical protein
MIRKVLIAIALSLGLSVPVSFVAQPASAASSDAIAQALVGATLENLGLEELSEELCAGLVGQLTAAIDAGVIDPAISSQVAGLLENPAMMSGLSDVFDAHLDGETSEWETWLLLNADSDGIYDGDEWSDWDDSLDYDESDEGIGDDDPDNSDSEGDSEDSDSSDGEDSNDSGRDESSDNDNDNDDDYDDDYDDDDYDDDYDDDSVD